MKKFNFLLVLFMSMIFSVFISCEKDSLQHDANANLQEDILKKGSRQGCSIEGISRKGDKLVFKDMEHFRKTLECLEDLLENHNAQFEQQYSYLQDDEYNDMADNLGFNDFLPLEEFENSLSFYSRRRFVEDEIQLWLNSPLFNLEEDPDDLDDLSEELRTLLSKEGKVIIGGKTIDYLGVEDDKSDGCRRFESDKKWEYYQNGDKAYKLKVGVRSYPWKMKAKAKVVSYKRKNGSYRRYRTQLFVQLGGFARSSACTFPLQIGDFNGPKRRISLKAKHVYWGPPTWAKYASSEVFGTSLVSPQELSDVLILTW